jgi:hypothetical protein
MDRRLPRGDLRVQVVAMCLLGGRDALPQARLLDLYCLFSARAMLSGRVQAVSVRHSDPNQRITRCPALIAMSPP